MDRQLQERLDVLRERCERGLKTLTVINRHDTHGNVLVVLETANEGNDTVGVPGAELGHDYHCHRYFTMDGNWFQSYDGQNVPLEAVWDWLADPSASSCGRYKVRMLNASK